MTNKTIISLENCSIFCKGEKCIRGSQENMLSYHTNMYKVLKIEILKERVAQRANQARLHRRDDFSPLLDHKLLEGEDHVL